MVSNKVQKIGISFKKRSGVSYARILVLGLAISLFSCVRSEDNLCIDKPIGWRYQDPLDCHGFFICHGKQAYQAYCDYSEKFDEQTQMCIPGKCPPCRKCECNADSKSPTTTSTTLIATISTTENPWPCWSTTTARSTTSSSTSTKRPTETPGPGCSTSPISSTISSTTPVIPSEGTTGLYSCEGRKDGEMFRDPTDCSRFYICSKGVEALQECADGLLFDTKHNACNHAILVNCNNGQSTTTHRTPSTISTKAISFTTPSPSTAIKPGSSTTTTSATTYPWPCWSTTTTRSTTSSSTSTKWPTITPGPGCITWPILSTKSSTTPAVPSEGTTGLHSCEGRKDGEIFRDPTDCSRFYICSKGIETLQECADGLLFDAKRNACNHAILVNCNNGQSTTTQRTPSTISTKAISSTTPYPSTATKPSSSTSSSTTTIGTTTSALSTTKKSKITSTSTAVYPCPCWPTTSSTTTVEPTTSTLPTPTTTITTLPTSTPTYPCPCWSTPSTTTTVRPTTSTLASTTSTSTKSSSSINSRPISTTLSSTLSTSTKSFSSTSSKPDSTKKMSTTPAIASTTASTMSYSCKGRRDGETFRDPTDCSRFYVCSKGSETLHSCPSGLMFDMRLHVCNHAFLVKCDDKGQTTTTQRASTMSSTFTAKPTTSTLSTSSNEPTNSSTSTTTKSRPSSTAPSSTSTVTSTVSTLFTSSTEPTTSTSTATYPCPCWSTTSSTTTVEPTTTMSTSTATRPCPCSLRTSSTTTKSQTSSTLATTNDVITDSSTSVFDRTANDVIKDISPTFLFNRTANDVMTGTPPSLLLDRTTNGLITTTSNPTTSTTQAITTIDDQSIKSHAYEGALKTTKDFFTETTKPTTTQSLPKDGQVDVTISECFGKPNGSFVRNKEHCRIYYTCRDNKAIKGSCPRGQWFDDEHFVCNVRSSVKCEPQQD